MNVELFGHQVSVKTKDCSLNGADGVDLDPYFNIYVRVTDFCDAACGFCNFHKASTRQFNVRKFMQALEAVSSVAKIAKVSFTGGEPTTQRSLLESLLYNVRSFDSNIFTVLSTNGFDIADFPMELLDSLAISRHHYDEYTSNQIFKRNPSTSLVDLLPILNAEKKVHLSCNVMKDFIGSSEEVYTYLSTFAEQGVEDFGFVSLMPVNNYAKDQRVDAETLLLETKATEVRRVYRKGLDCRCTNFETQTDFGNVMSYARSNLNPSKCESLLVFDIDTLREGFNGQVLI